MTRLEGLSDMEHLSGEAFVGTLAYEYQASSWGFAANAGYRVQSYLEIPEDRWGHRFEYGAGVHWTPGRFGVKGEMLGSIPVYAFKEGGQFPLEVLGSGHGEITPHLRVHLGAGVGVSRGIGSPKLRLFSMLEWRPDLSKDNDRDGIVNVRDWCPNRPEDMDEFRDKNGCPDLDNDRDQVLDVEDACPLIPETYNEYLDEDGCPDIAGQVLVQVVGEERGSISVARVTAGERASIRVIEGDVLTFPVYGPVLTVNVEAEGHYPMRRVAEIEQNGEETVLVFRLQQIPENATGTPFDDSFLEALTLELEQSMEFELDSAVLGEEDWASLDELAAYLNAHLEIRLIRVEGFADEVGASAYNYDLSQRRAEAVYTYLVDKGVAPYRMQPIATGEALRSQHPVAVRRVEFTVLIWADPENESAPSLPEGAP
jgi:outer membrane protein OmpA-like peptidoglycan-associated protein